MSVPSGVGICAKAPPLARKPAPSEGIVAASVENDEVEPPTSALHLAEHKRGIEQLKIDNARGGGGGQSYRMYLGSR